MAHAFLSATEIHAFTRNSTRSSSAAPATAPARVPVRLAVAETARKVRRDTLRVDRNGNGYDYQKQAWVIGGRYETCAHPASMNCDCYGKLHHGETAE